MTQNKKPSKVRFLYRHAGGYRIIHATGAFGGITPQGNVKFDLFTEFVAVPDQEIRRIREDGTLGERFEETRDEDTVTFTRELQVGVVMSVGDAKALATWLLEKVEEYERQKQQGQGGSWTWVVEAETDETELFLEKCSGWEDSRSPDEIIAGIYAARSESLRGLLSNEPQEILERVKEMTSAYVKKAAQVSKVQRIDVAYADGEVYVYTFLTDRDVEARDRLYDIEMECLQEFPDLPVSFHVLSDPSNKLADACTIFVRDQK